MSTTYLPDVPLAKIKPHPKNPRIELKDIDTLAANIKTMGLLEPLVLATPTGSSAAYTLIAGHRRLAAAKAAGLTTVPATVREDLDTPAKQLAAILSENTQRVDLSPVEEADAFTQLVAFPGMTQAKAAKATGRSLSFVKQRLALAKLPDGARKKMHAGEITLEQAATIMSFVGTPEYSKVVKAAGTTNFGFTVENAKREQKARAQLDVVKAHAEAQGWKITDSYNDCGRSVLDRWRVRGLEKQLAALEGPHVLYTNGLTLWSINLVPTSEDLERKPDYQPTPEQEAAQAAAAQRLEDLDTARTVRQQWLDGRLKNLLESSFDHAAILRMLVADVVERTDYTGEQLALAGFTLPEGKRAWEAVDDTLAWVDGLNYNQLWKALLVLTFDLATCGGRFQESHEHSIRIAMALGYEPSDIELALITPEVKA